MTIDESLLDELVSRIRARIALLQRFPVSTYRLQLHKDFTFRHATAIVPYLAELGISHVYASPYFKAVPGSQHGYDVLDHCSLNPELGTQADFDAFLEALRSHKMSHIIDFVPNHVGVASNDNAWWNDVLENGQASRFAKYFDITWNNSPPSNANGRLLLPVLGAAYGDILEKGELTLKFDAGRFYVAYFDRRFPISPRSIGYILHPSTGTASQTEFKAILDRASFLPERCDGSAAAESRHLAKDAIQRELAELCDTNSSARQYVESCLQSLNGKPGISESFDQLDALLQHQCYRLASWQTGPDEINYRRFFDVNDLAAITMERPEVFDATHTLALSLAARGDVTGMRIDHPDGLFDPAAYFVRLQEQFVLSVAKTVIAEDERFASLDVNRLATKLLDRIKAATDSHPNLYVLGEKILAMNEAIPKDWPTHGTSGYDFLNMTNGLFVDGRNADRFTQIYCAWIGNSKSFEDLIYEKKKLILEISLASELHMLAIDLKRLAESERHSQDFTLSILSASLKEVIACFSVYRTYIATNTVTEIDRERINHAIDLAIDRNPQIPAPTLNFIRDTLLLMFGPRFTEEDRAKQRHFAGKFQQLTSPTTAKGIEDTAFYIYNRLLSLNEVGGDPATFGVTPEQLHAYYIERQRNWPFTMSTLSTHDTKRSEDVRARINVLSEMPDEWQRWLTKWSSTNDEHRTMVDGTATPDRNDEYGLYQVLLGSWPESNGRLPVSKDFIQRLHQYLTKAMRESKVHTSWTRPNEQYENATLAFLEKILDAQTGQAFLKSFLPAAQAVSRAGHIKSIAQTILKLTAPGVPDTYQGTEFWDLSLVDPDNRRPVDYALRTNELHRYESNTSTPSIDDQGHKIQLTAALLRLRREHSALFSESEYIPLTVTADPDSHYFAFARHWQDRIIVVVVPRLLRAAHSGIDAHVTLPDAAKASILTNVMTRESVTINNSRLNITDLIGAWPYAILMGTL